MNNGTQITIQDAVQKLTLYGLKECAEDMRSQYNIECLYAFECLDEDSTCLVCGTEADVFALLFLVEEAALQ